VRRLMDSWIWQPGYPLVTATLDGETGELVLRQTRFSFSITDDDGARWVVPVTVRHGERTDRFLLDGDEARLPLSDADVPVVVNAGGHGFFRVAYDDHLRARLSGEALTGLDTLERYNLVDDAWNAVVAGRISAIEFLEFVEGFTAERDLAVWQAIVGGLRGLGRLLDDHAYDAFGGRVATFLEPVVDDLGDPTPNEDDLVGKLRGLLIGALAVLGNHRPTRDRCRELFDRAAAEPGTVDPEMVAAATSVVAATGDDADYERMLAGFRDGATPQEQLRHLNALAEFDDAELIERTCELAMSGEVKTQNAPFLLRSCIANRHHGTAAWHFVRDHWSEALDRFPSNTIVRMVGSITMLNRPAEVADVHAFFAEHPITQAMKTMEQLLERQRVNADLRARESESLAVAVS
jgi:puromycin-sensitive aminopeptidase